MKAPELSNASMIPGNPPRKNVLYEIVTARARARNTEKFGVRERTAAKVCKAFYGEHNAVK